MKKLFNLHKMAFQFDNLDVDPLQKINQKKFEIGLNMEESIATATGIKITATAPGVAPVQLCEDAERRIRR